jgi:hypothetical protein
MSSVMLYVQMFDIVTPLLYNIFVKPPKMGRSRFSNFDCALYALDVKFQTANRPTGTFMDAKRYFSGKHKLYGYKVECAVSVEGVAVHVSKHYPGSVSDKRICEDYVHIHRQMLRKSSDDTRLQDFSEGASRFPNEWAMLVDKGYQGIGDVLRSIHPKRQPPCSSLSPDDIERNRRVSSDRVIVENYFGRVNMLWKVMYMKYTWSENRYDGLVQLCFALTNYHITLQPLRQQDGEHYQCTIAKYVSMAEDQVLKKRRSSAMYRHRRRSRLNFTPPSFSSPNGSNGSTRSSYDISSSLSPAF